MYIKLDISSQCLNRLKRILVVSKLHKSLSGLSHFGKADLIYVLQNVLFA